MADGGFTIEDSAPIHLHRCDLTEDGIALAFTQTYHQTLRYCHTTGSWFQWTGKAWRKEQTKLAFSYARHACRTTAKENGATDKQLASLTKAATASGVERFAQSDRAFAVTASIWDANRWLLGTPEGTVDLKTGFLRQPSSDDYITKLTAVAPASLPNCPLWLKFLNEATAGDNELIRFLQQWCGYGLTGDIREHALLFVYGSGGNGKGVFLNTVSRIMGEYAKTAAMDTFTASRSNKHPTDLAMLHGARMVNASETEEGHAWAEARIKQMTGGDTITARFMHKDFFEYDPQFKLTIIGNHKPVLKNVDDAARRRFNIVPFNHKPVHKDKQLEEKLKAEWPGILRWMIEGCLDWQENGLIRPQVVTDATADYFGEQDTLAQWLEDCCDMEKDNADTNRSLFGSWMNYTKFRGEEAGTAKRFGTMLEGKGFQRIKDRFGITGRGYRGLKVREAGYDYG